jgi:amino acid adenylation domain-containing protein
MIGDLVRDLRQRKIRIWADGGRLRYEAPRDALTPELTERLRANKAELIEWCNRARSTRLESIPAVDRSEPLRLSRGQLRMWFLWMLDPESAAYCAPVGFRISGPFDTAVFAEALELVRRRHESLRTRFGECDGQPVQVIDDGPLCLQITDLSDRPPAVAGEIAKERLDALMLRPMDLRERPPFEVHIFKVGDGRHDILIRLHHIIYDGWSNHLFLTELWTAYNALAEGTDPALPHLGIQYADFAAWQHDRLTGSRRDELLGYWTRQLRGAATAIRLPVRQGGEVDGLAEVDTVPITVPQDTLSRLETLCRETGATMFMLLTAALRVVLARYSGEGDFIIGTPAMRRVHPDVENLIGYFGNTLLLRTPIALTHTYRKALALERETALAAYQHQELPFDMLVEALAPNRSDAGAPLFQVMFLFGEKAPASVSVGPLEVDYLEDGPTGSKSDLGLWIKHAPSGGLSGHFDFAPRRYERRMIEGLTRRFQLVLEAMANRPDEAIGATQLLSRQELDQLLLDWNPPFQAADDTLIPEMVRLQAVRSPEATAILHGSDAVTYGELDLRARALAERLLALGGGPGDPVLVCLPRDPALVAALLAVMAVGAAYVPVDPAYPEERRRIVLEDSGARVMICVPDQVPGEVPCGVALLDASAVTAAAPADWAALSAHTGPDDVAWVLYTSGSTGKPKGVEIRHGGAAALIHWAHQAYSERELAGVLAGTSVCFDLSVFELFVPLCGGHAVILADSPLDLFGLPARDRVTLINTVPSVMRTLLSMAGATFPAGLQTVNLAGEPLSTDLVNAVYERTGAARVYDLYGPTEATTYATRKLRTRTGRPAIGKTIAGTRAYVLDPSGMPLPPGATGELFLAGETLARGYLGRPDLTAERFAPPAADCIPATRLYRTGDLVRHTGDGELEYVGRCDDQLKIRGYRIEPGEVRMALLAVDGVEDAVVTGHRDDGGNLFLAAYVIGTPEAVSARRLRGELAGVLPDFMVPTFFTRVERFPLTPNGKVDLARLSPETQSPEPLSAAPQTATELAIAGIWKELLGRDVGRQDHFFETGGTSMSAMLLVGRINARFETQLPLRALFEQPTVEALARLVEHAPRRNTLRPEDTYETSNVPMTLLQRHLWLVHRAAANAAFLNLWQTMTLTGPLDREAFRNALATVVERHPILGARFPVVEKYVRQSYEKTVPAPSELDLCGIADEEERRKRFDDFCYELGAPFDLEAGPCLRMGIVQLSPDRQLVLIIVHHIIVDEWSLARLVGEIRDLYLAGREGRPAPAAKSSVSFADHALWEMRCRAEGRFEDEMAAWAAYLRRPLTRLPLDWSAGDEPALGGTYRFTVPAELWQNLKCLAARERCSLFVLTLAMLMLLLRRRTGEADIRVCTNISRRHQHDFEGTIGPLTDSLIVRGALDSPQAGEALRSVRDSLLDVYTILAIPFEEMATRLSRQHGIARSELAQVFFLLHEEDTPQEASSADDTPPLRMSPDFFSSADHAYDLVLYLSRLDDRIEGHLTLKGGGQAVHEAVAAEYLDLLNELVRTEGPE